VRRAVRAPLCPATAFRAVDRNDGYHASISSRDSSPKLSVVRNSPPADCRLVGTCTFLASDAASFITGQIIVIDSGATFHY